VKRLEFFTRSTPATPPSPNPLAAHREPNRLQMADHLPQERQDLNRQIFQVLDFVFPLQGSCGVWQSSLHRSRSEWLYAKCWTGIDLVRCFVDHLPLTGLEKIGFLRQFRRRSFSRAFHGQYFEVVGYYKSLLLHFQGPIDVCK
jgi:hypothetical protein